MKFTRLPHAALAALLLANPPQAAWALDCAKSGGVPVRFDDQVPNSDLTQTRGRAIKEGCAVQGDAATRSLKVVPADDGIDGNTYTTVPLSSIKTSDLEKVRTSKKLDNGIREVAVTESVERHEATRPELSLKPASKHPGGAGQSTGNCRGLEFTGPGQEKPRPPRPEATTTNPGSATSEAATQSGTLTGTQGAATTPAAPVTNATTAGGIIPGTQASTLETPAAPPARPVDATTTVDVASTAATVATITQQAVRTDFLDTVVSARRALEERIERDDAEVSEPYRDLPIAALAEHLERAEQSLQQTAVDLGLSDPTSNAASERGGMDRAEIARFRNLYANARDKAALGTASIREEERRRSALGANSPFAGLLGPQPNALARTEQLAAIFGTGKKPGAAATNDGLVNRLVMFNGLPADKQAAMAKKLALIESTPVRLPSGETHIIPILHNGYILGGGRTGLDCSSFVSSSLPAEVRKGSFTTLDFRQMWYFRRTGNFPNPPNYDEKRARLVRETATAFTAIDLYEGEGLAPGDLLVYRLPWEVTGHVFIVRNFNPATLQVEVIEASQSAGTVREREFALTTDPVDRKPSRRLRPGLLALRIRPVSNRGCSYRDSASASSHPTSNSRPPEDTGTPQKGGGAAE